MTECGKVKKLLDEYLDQQLSPQLDNMVEQHLHACEDCRREYENWLEIKQLLTESHEAEIPSRHYFARLFITLLPSLRLGHWWEGWRRWVSLPISSYRFRKAVALASLIVVGFLGGLIMTRAYFRPQSVPTPLSSIPVITPEEESVRSPSSVAIPTSRPPDHIIKSALDLSAPTSEFWQAGVSKVKSLAKSLFSTPSPDSTWLEGRSELVSSMSPEIKRLHSVASQLEKSQLLETMQDIKFHLYLNDKEEFIPAFHQVEEALAELTYFSRLSKASGERLVGSDEEALNIYQQAENAVIRKDYGQAREQYYQVLEKSPHSYLALLSYLQIANIEFEVLENYKSALENYKTCLEKSDINYTPVEMRNHIISRIELLSKNSQDDWRPLRLYLKANKSKPSTAIALYKDLLESYPATPLAEEAIKELTNFTLDRNYADLIGPEETIRLFQAQLQKDLAVSRKQLLQLALADIFNFRLHNQQQALLEYSRVINMGTENNLEVVRTARYRIRNIYSLRNY